ncbi:MAG: class I SAM-dependent methyltransferase [Vicinamibacterales bacterium]
MSLCDFGCGTGELLAHARRRGLDRLVYLGVDRSAAALEHARRKFPRDAFSPSTSPRPAPMSRTLPAITSWPTASSPGATA